MQKEQLSPSMNSPFWKLKKNLGAIVLCDHLEGWDREGGRETQEGGDMGIYVYV